MRSEQTEEAGRQLATLPPDEARRAVADTLKHVDADADGALSEDELFGWLRRSYGCARPTPTFHIPTFPSPTFRELSPPPRTFPSSYCLLTALLRFDYNCEQPRILVYCSKIQ